MTDQVIDKVSTPEEAQSPKRKPLGLNLQGAIQSGGVPGDKSETSIRQNLSHGRSKTVTVEMRNRRIRPKTELEDSKESIAKLTHQEQSLRLKAVKESLDVQVQEELKETEEKRLRTHLQEQEALTHKPEVMLPSSPPTSENSGPAIPVVTIPSDREDKRKKPRDYEEKREVKGADVPESSKVEGRKRVLLESQKRKNPTKLLVEIAKVDPEVIVSEDRRSIFGLKKLRKHGSSRRAIPSSVGSLRIEIPAYISLQDLALKMAKKVNVLTKILGKMGEVGLSPQHIVDAETAEYLVQEVGHQAVHMVEIDEEERLWTQEASSPHWEERAPVVTIMGHVDHGKTSLLDALRKTSVVSGEAGGITQHIGAYQVVMTSGKRITFIDTPGHKAFTQMRARGAQLTDIVVLVVAADDGINAQTVEAISHAQAAGVPIIVAINKIDKPGARPDKIREQLLSHSIVVEKLGGDVLDVEVSALAHTNLDKLEEAILLQAELLGLQADPDGPARGLVLETRMKKGQGPAATILVQRGTLRPGDFCVAGMVGGKARLLFDDRGIAMKEAGPSMPVEVCGLSTLPSPGQRFMVLENESKVKEFLAWKKESGRPSVGPVLEGSPSDMSMDTLFNTPLKSECFLVLKADVQGSLEGLYQELSQLVHAEVALNIVHQGVGPVNESDVALAQASKAFIVAFNVPVLPAAKVLAQRDGVTIIPHQIIYHAVDDIRERVSGLLKPEMREEVLGMATVLQVFTLSRGKNALVAGCTVNEGVMRRGEKARVIRGGKIVHTGPLESLYHLKNEMKEVKAGYECGIGLVDFPDIQSGDRIECFSVKAIPRSL